MPQLEEDVVTTTKERIVEASAELFLRQGYVGTGMKQIVTGARAPSGSVYHFFPGGKEELGAAVIRWSGEVYAAIVADALADEDDLVTAVEAAFAAAAQSLVDSDYADACPIATVALEVSSSSEVLRQACAEVFESWLDGLAARFAVGGVPDGSARALAHTFLMLLEGAFILCRATRTTEALDHAGTAAGAATRAALGRS